MVRFRFMAAALLALVFAGNSIQTGRTQPVTPAGYPTTESKPTADDACVIYSLTDMGYDADLGTWIAQTVPEMIEPNSWQGRGGMAVIRYYAPKNILIVKQTKTIQKKVDSFLKELKISMHKASPANTTSRKGDHPGVVPADYREPALLRTTNPASETFSYPVPAAVKPPKHLFHFIIRYEGEGIIDDNVVRFMKAQAQGGKPLVGVVPTITADAPPAPPAVSEKPPLNVDAPPAAGISYPSPYSSPEQPIPAPKNKKGKKDDHKGNTSNGTAS